MDSGDISVELQEAEEARREEQARRRREEGKAESLDCCEDCDAPIPEARRALGGVTRCVECAEIEERRRG